MVSLVIDGRLRDVQRMDESTYGGRYKDIAVMASIIKLEDGHIWVHGSVSRRDRTIPTYEDMKMMKELVFGPERTAVQIFVPDKEHIDIGTKLPNPIEVLHLWGRYSKDRWLPDFTQGKGTI